MGVNIGGKVNVKLFWPILFDYGKLHTDKLVIIGKNIYINFAVIGPIIKARAASNRSPKIQCHHPYFPL